MNKKQVNSLRKYFNKNITIIGLNDSQTSHLMGIFTKNGMIEYIASKFKALDINPLVINVSSLSLNKTYHIDSFIEHNISLDKIKSTQVNGTISAIENMFGNHVISKVIGSLGNITRLFYRKNEMDQYLKLKDILKEDEPIVIYSSAVNDLMREVANNPCKIESDFEKRGYTLAYDYTIGKANDEDTLLKIEQNVRKNLKNITELNSHASLYVIGIPIPNHMNNESSIVFHNLIKKYNEVLKKITLEYSNAHFIDLENISEKIHYSPYTTHLTKRSSHIIGDSILNHIYINGIANREKDKVFNKLENNDLNIVDMDEYLITNDNEEKEDSHNSIREIIKDLAALINEYYQISENQVGYKRRKTEDIMEEIEREIKILEKSRH